MSVKIKLTKKQLPATVITSQDTVIFITNINEEHTKELNNGYLYYDYIGNYQGKVICEGNIRKVLHFTNYTKEVK